MPNPTRSKSVQRREAIQKIPACPKCDRSMPLLELCHDCQEHEDKSDGQ